MTVILFIVVLAILILAHEVGHFLAAKSVGVRVDEFGIGFPPRLYSWRPTGSETLYSINWIPFGGFVKIFKEDEDITGLTQEEKEKTLDAKPWYAKVWVLIAGVLFNVLLAWGLISIGITLGFPMSVTPETQGIVGVPSVVLIHIDETSPARDAGFLPGDELVSIAGTTETLEGQLSIVSVQDFIARHGEETLTIAYTREKELKSTTVVPEVRVIGQETRGVIGVALDYIAVVRLPLWLAVIEGAKTTYYATQNIAVGLWQFLYQAVTGAADFSQVVGPVGIVGLAGDAARMGLVTLLSFAAMLSLNLAVINMVPFPALDGGRILFVIIEAIKRSPIKPVVANTFNIVGFGLLILLMVVVTIHDVVKLF
ncbi:MAG: site-2 protease family protein [Candidatus Campbellbacteria bacterium]|nr:site-2 protease family protein [Candidatus Campbellbacteria bacterium]